VLHHSITPARNASRSDAGGPSLRVAGFEDEDDDKDSLPDEALPSSAGSSVIERSRENEALSYMIYRLTRSAVRN
jgi:hypothetical protein